MRESLYIDHLFPEGMLNQMLISCCIDLGLPNHIRELKEIDRRICVLLHKAGYKPSQLRAPAGTPIGGQ